jgi:hypothetical protein
MVITGGLKQAAKDSLNSIWEFSPYLKENTTPTITKTNLLMLFKEIIQLSTI